MMTADLGVGHLLEDDQNSPPAGADSSAPDAFELLALYPTDSTEQSYWSRREDLASHLARLGSSVTQSAPSPLARLQGRSLLDRIGAEKLTGHGGGHFPVAVKWRSVMESGPVSMVVANAAEGEPLSAKDAALLQLRPHQVLDGAQLAAATTGAREIILWLHTSAAASRSSIEYALFERRTANYRELPVRIMLCPDRYLSGEMTAVARGVAGGPSLPTYQPVPGPPIDKNGNVSLIHNVETLAHVAHIGLRGASDSRLVTVCTANARVVVAAGPSVTIGGAIAQARRIVGLTPELAQGVLLGGYGGQWVPWQIAHELAIDEPSLRSRGLSLGAGIIAPLPANTCGIKATASIFRYLADSSARQCGPCMFGLPALADLLDTLAYNKLRRSEARRMEKYMALLVRRGACAHPDGALRMLASALTTFADDAASHTKKGRCLHPAAGPMFPIPSAT